MKSPIENSLTTAQLFTRLANQELLVTVNNRLADAWRRAYDENQLALGLDVWETPQILPLSQWLQQCLQKLQQQGDEKRTLLEPVQEKLLWSDVIAHSSFDSLVMQPEAISRQVMQAWQLARQWQVPMTEIAASGLQEAEALTVWSRQFETRCSRAQWLSTTELPAIISHALQNNLLVSPASMIFDGFQDPNRLHEQLWQSLIASGCELFELREESRNRQLSRQVCLDFSDEIQTAANWTKALLERGEKRIAVVVPALNDQREQVADIFERTLHPERIDSLPPYSRRDLYTLSLGLPLADYPLVSDALAVLSLLQRSFSLSDLERVLQAVYLSSDTRHPGADMADVIFALRRFGRKTWTLKALAGYLKKHQANGSRLLLERLEKLEQIKNGWPAKQTARQWSEAFVNSCKLMGWPGGRSLDSNEYQQSQRLLKLLNEFRRLANVQPQMTLNEAARLLRSLARDTVFQPQAAVTPVLVAGLLEAAGQHFEHVWLCNLDDRVLPPATAPNPFIPVSLQRHYQLPHSSSERELDYAWKLLRGFISHSVNLVLSHATREGDVELRASPLLSRLAEQGYPLLQLPESPSGKQPAADNVLTSLETYEDNQLPALAEKQPVKGGSGILTAQAACPFQAAAAYRLKATEPETEQDGVSAIERGNQVHEILHRVWQQLQTREHLMQLDAQAVTELVETCVTEALQSARYRRPDLYQPKFFELEIRYLTELIAEWLELEKQRSDFRVVSLEEPAKIAIGGLYIDTKADRIDELANGERVILDYKTGASASSKSWITETLSEPQLPLYSLIESEQLTALALAKVHERQCRFDGISRLEGQLPFVKPVKTQALLSDHLPQGSRPDDVDEDARWHALRSHWRNRLEAIGNDFRLGNAEINPSSCRYCPFPALCRKHELTNNSHDEDSTAGEQP